MRRVASPLLIGGARLGACRLGTGVAASLRPPSGIRGPDTYLGTLDTAIGGPNACVGDFDAGVCGLDIVMLLPACRV